MSKIAITIHSDDRVGKHPVSAVRNIIIVITVSPPKRFPESYDRFPYSRRRFDFIIRLSEHTSVLGFDIGEARRGELLAGTTADIFEVGDDAVAGHSMLSILSVSPLSLCCKGLGGITSPRRALDRLLK
eukprot:3418065-Amphidinium_carterae.2